MPSSGNHRWKIFAVIAVVLAMVVGALVVSFFSGNDSRSAESAKAPALSPGENAASGRGVSAETSSTVKTLAALSDGGAELDSLEKRRQALNERLAELRSNLIRMAKRAFIHDPDIEDADAELTIDVAAGRAKWSERATVLKVQMEAMDKLQEDLWRTSATEWLQRAPDQNRLQSKAPALSETVTSRQEARGEEAALDARGVVSGDVRRAAWRQKIESDAATLAAAAAAHQRESAIVNIERMTIAEDKQTIADFAEPQKLLDAYREHKAEYLRLEAEQKSVEIRYQDAWRTGLPPERIRDWRRPAGMGK